MNTKATTKNQSKDRVAQLATVVQNLQIEVAKIKKDGITGHDWHTLAEEIGRMRPAVSRHGDLTTSHNTRLDDLEASVKELKRDDIACVATAVLNLQTKVGGLQASVKDLEKDGDSDERAIADLWGETRRLAAKIEEGTLAWRMDALVKRMDTLEKRMDNHTKCSTMEWEKITKEYRIERTTQDELAVRIRKLEEQRKEAFFTAHNDLHAVYSRIGKLQRSVDKLTEPASKSEAAASAAMKLAGEMITNPAVNPGAYPDKDDARDWLAYIYNCRGDMTPEVWNKYKNWCEGNGILLHSPRFEDLPG